MISCRHGHMLVCVLYNVIYFFLQLSDVTLQMVFFDGEEALVSWTSTDSLYGARHLAEKWSGTRHPKGSNTTMIDTIVSIISCLCIFLWPKIYFILSSTFWRARKITRKIQGSNVTFNSELLHLLDVSTYTCSHECFTGKFTTCKIHAGIGKAVLWNGDYESTYRACDAP